MSYSRILKKYNQTKYNRPKYQIKIKSSLYCTRGITQKRVTSDGAHLHGLATGLHSSEETSQRWRPVGDTVPI